MTWSSNDLRSLSITDVRDDELSIVRRLFATWAARLPKTLKRSLYYDAEQKFRDLGIALPPQLRNAKFYLSWASMAVRRPALRSQFDGLRLPGSDDPFELGEILDANDFALEFQQSVVSAYKHSCSFITVGKGDIGEAPAQIIGHSAETAAGLWDRRKRRMEAMLTITDTDQRGNPTEFNVYLPDVVLVCSRASGRWAAERISNITGRVLGVVVRNDPQLTRPFGRSRLSNSVMSLNDMAVRAFVRMEGNAEFYSTPQLAILGISDDAFAGASPESAKFKLAMDRLLALTKDEDGDKPELKQLQQATMTPHSDMLRTVAMAFSGETGLSPSSLGVLHDNPSSAEAIRAAEHELLIDVHYQNKFVLSSAVKQVAALAVMVRDGLSEPPDEMWKLSARFVDPEFRSLGAEADALTKLAPAMPQLAQYPTLLERIFDEDEVARIAADQKASLVTGFIDSIRNGQPALPTAAVQSSLDQGANNQATPDAGGS